MKWMIVIFFFFSLSCAKYSNQPYIYLNAETGLKDEKGNYFFGNLIDGSREAWCEGVKGSGIGQNLTFQFAKNTEFNAFYIKNGMDDLQGFGERNRVKEFQLSLSVDDSLTIPVKDTGDFQRLALKKTFSGLIFNLKIISVYKGSKFDDTCISEISFRPVALTPKHISAPLKKPLLLQKEDYQLTLLSQGKLTGTGEGNLSCKFPFQNGWWHVTNEGRIFANIIIDTSGECQSLERSVLDHPYRGYLSQFYPD
jgi:hypothetical protein